MADVADVYEIHERFTLKTFTLRKTVADGGCD